MSKFKVGDKVRFTRDQYDMFSAAGGATKGQEGVVVKVDPEDGFFTINDDGDPVMAPDAAELVDA